MLFVPRNLLRPQSGRALLFVSVLFSGLATAGLFLFTGQPVPRSVEPLGAFAKNLEFCISDCGRIGIGINSAENDGEKNGVFQTREAWQLWPQQRIAAIENYRGEPSVVCLNTDKGLMATSDLDSFEIWRWPSCKSVWKHRYVGGSNPDLLSLSRDGTRLIACTENLQCPCFRYGERGEARPISACL